MSNQTERKSVRREFWVHKGSSNFCQELEYDVDKDAEVRARPDGFYDIVSTADTVEGGIRVREVLPGDIVLSADEVARLREGIVMLRYGAQSQADFLLAILEGSALDGKGKADELAEPNLSSLS